MEFYAEKSRDLPRFIYRNFLGLLAQQGNLATRGALVDKFCQFLGQLQPNGDWLKMKWCLPPNLNLTEEEKTKIEAALSQKRKRRNDKLLEVYPHCSDEFSTSTEFLDSAFGSRQFSLIDPTTKVFTIGSCFARNIANYLLSKGFTVSPFVQAEDLNSPFSNAKMLAICAAEPAIRRAYIEHWVHLLYPPDKYDLKAVVENELRNLEKLIASLRSSEFLIVTCGNVLDYFMPPSTQAFEVGPAVAPKFLAISNDEDIALRALLTHKLKEAGSEFRLGNYAEVNQALDSLYRGIRVINPEAQLLFTLSPVPIDSAIGANASRKLSALEIDCVSKSLLRAALNEFLERNKSDAKLYYFPSFEIVRWVGACMDGAIFGKQDAASRHISQTILTGVYEYFIHKFCIAEHLPQEIRQNARM